MCLSRGPGRYAVSVPRKTGSQGTAKKGCPIPALEPSNPNNHCGCFTIHSKCPLCMPLTTWQRPLEMRLPEIMARKQQLDWPETGLPSLTACVVQGLHWGPRALCSGLRISCGTTLSPFFMYCVLHTCRTLPDSSAAKGLPGSPRHQGRTRRAVISVSGIPQPRPTHMASRSRITADFFGSQVKHDTEYTVVGCQRRGLWWLSTTV